MIVNALRSLPREERQDCRDQCEKYRGCFRRQESELHPFQRPKPPAPFPRSDLYNSPMPFNTLVRQVHRWTSIAFTLAVIANFVQIGLGGGKEPNWVTYSPLLPLALLLFTGLYMFSLPYLVKRRSE